MSSERSTQCAPKSPLCPSCARIMRFARASRFADLCIQYVFECRACGGSHIDANRASLTAPVSLQQQLPQELTRRIAANFAKLPELSCVPLKSTRGASRAQWPICNIKIFGQAATDLPLHAHNSP